MSDNPADTSTAGGPNSLAPPAPVRSNSSTSVRSNSSRRGHRSPGSSASVSRSNSYSSKGGAGGSDPSRKKSGNTTTISGGTSLGGKSSPANNNSASQEGHKRSRTKGSIASGAVPVPTDTASSSRNLSRRSSTKRSEARQIPSRPGSATPSIPEQTSEPAVRSIQFATSPPISAMEAAVNAATKKHHETHGDNALASLQRMISDLKAISPSASTAGSRQASGSLKDKPQSPSTSQGPSDATPSPTASTQSQSGTAPVAIPASKDASSTRLKADAPTFTPGSLRSNASPTIPTSSISSNMPPPQQSRQASMSSNSNKDHHRRTSTQAQSISAGFGGAGFGYINQGYPGLPHFPLLNAGGFPGGDGLGNDEFAAAEPYQQQQLLAAQQLQLQILQAQIMQQQLASQQQREQSFIAPRFQALAAQRAAVQQQQQASQFAEAQRLFEMHQQQQQQQLLLAQQQQSAEAAPLQNAPPVFEDESPENTPSQLGPTGRPQLNPAFTFGKRRDSATNEDKSRAANRTEAGASLAGLAARAHRRSGSELTPAMEQQLEIQRQIEALQAKQRELMQQEKSRKDTSTGLESLSQHAVSRHRRTQSSISTASAAAEIGVFPSPDAAKEPEQSQKASRPLGEMGPPPLPPASSHSRRHSMNVFNKGFGGAGFGEYVEDRGSISIPPGQFGNHHRSGSRSGTESGNWRLNGAGAGGGSATADLASAQAQLASLAQFRAAAGSGHAKMASFSLPNMLPNLLAATTLQTPSGQSSLWQQQQAFQMQLQQNAQGPQRKSLFAPYLPQASLPPLLSAGKLVVGILRVNKKNRSDAYVATDVLDADIYICGSKDRNRALEGDIVAVELLDVDEVWSTKKDKEEKKRKKEESYDIKPTAAKKLEKKKDDIEVEGQGLTLFEDEEVNDDTKPTYAGHVVAVVERMPGQLFSGQLGVLRPSSAATKEKQEAERREREGDKAKPAQTEPEPRPKIVWFKPTDKRVPLIAIPTEQAPVDFIENPEAHSNKLFVATIKRWPITSLHPFGTLVEELGPIGDSEVETSAVLKDCNFPTEEFADVALKCLPPLPWTVPEREYEVRMDMRDDRVFTVDPPSARDLDDALSVKTNSDGTFTVGVHIADVSYFVKPNTALDRDARKRATSVYLVQRAVPMLPPLLSEQLCSLVPDVERLAFSAFFVIDRDGNVLERSYRRTIIKSSAQLSYSDVTDVLGGKALSGTSNVSPAHSAADIEKDISLLNDLAHRLREKRVEGGALLGNRQKIAFTIDDSGRPIDVAVEKRDDANIMVEEFMLLTNTSIATVIANGLPEQALLRRHEPPLERRLESFITIAKRLGYEFDGTSAGTLQKSFDKITDPEATLCLNLLGKKTLQQARYFCAGMLDIAKYGHWALNAPLYTHFTSPIRRYADVLVHRMLDACLSSASPTSDAKFIMDRDQIAKCAQHCNMKRQSGRLAEDQSRHLFLCIMISDLSEQYGPVIRQARVTSVYDQAFDIVVPEFGLEKRVHVDKMPIENSVYDEHSKVLSLYWTTQDVLSYLTSQTTEDEHLRKIKQRHEARASGADSRAADVHALFDDNNRDAAKHASIQYQKSAAPPVLRFEGLRETPSGHRIQDVKEFATLPVIITADMAKSPPVLVVYACNPYAKV